MVDAGNGPKTPGSSLISKPIVLVVLGAVVVALALGINLVTRNGGDTATTSPGSQTATSARATTLPAFDVVRVDAQGNAVIAGRAKPGSSVVILDGDTEIGRVVADGRGEWVFIPTQPLQAGNRSLRLKMIEPDGTETFSAGAVALMVPEGQGGALAVLTPGEEDAASRVLQTPGGESGLAITIDAIDYDDAGNLIISGTAQPSGTVNLYLDNALIGRAQVDEKGVWSLKPDTTVEPGLYTLRADRIDDAGKVISRTEVPFSRAKTETTGLKPGSFVVVQPGNSLWRLARQTYGRGVRYTLIFQANTDKIKDPDLIYPGQVFTLPTP